MQKYHNFNDNQGGHKFTFSSKKSPCPKCLGKHFCKVTHISGIVNTKGGGKCFSIKCNAFINPSDRIRTITDLTTDEDKFKEMTYIPDSMQVRAEPVIAKPSHFAFIEKYIYEDENGIPLFEVHRKEGRNKDGSVFLNEKGFKKKNFPQYIAGTYEKIGDTRRVLYRLPQITTAAQEGKAIFIVEGEKDVHTLEQLGFVATCNVGGAAGKWNPEYSKTLQNATVVILPDNDDPGRIHAEKVAHSLQGVVASVTIIGLPNLPHKGDVTDFVTNGGTREDILNAIRESQKSPPAEKTSEPQSHEQEFIEEFTLYNAAPIPDDIYDVLPQFPQQLLYPFDNHERGVLLSAMWPVLSAHMPKVFIRNKRDKYYLNVYMFICGDSSAGKNTATHARRLGNVADKQIFEETLARRQSWDVENSNRNKQGKKLVSAEPPKPMPVVRRLYTAGDVSAAALKQEMYASGGYGAMFETEADTVIQALKKDFGGWQDVVRNSFDHNPVSQARVQNKEKSDGFLLIETPILSICTTGTPSQAEKLLGRENSENGVIQRFGFYYLNSRDEYISQAADDSFDERENLFTVASKLLNSLRLKLLSTTEPERRVHFTNYQITEIIDKQFQEAREIWQERSPALVSIINRSPILAMRIAGILTVLRAMEFNDEDICCDIGNLTASDIDVQTAVSLSLLYFDHLARFAVNRLGFKIYTSDSDEDSETLNQKVIELLKIDPEMKAYAIAKQLFTGIDKKEFNRLKVKVSRIVKRLRKNGISGNSSNSVTMLPQQGDKLNRPLSPDDPALNGEIRPP